MIGTAKETTLERTVREEQARLEQAGTEYPSADGTASGENPEEGKLFEVPRVKVTVDESDPSVLKVAFSGNIELDRAKPADVAFFNRLAAGNTAALHIEAHIAGSKKTHRRDSEGDVDAIVETKSLIVHSIVDLNT